MTGTLNVFGDPGRIAPSVDKQWRDDFILELRLLSVPGPQIGDALMTVETHVVESGETAVQAFGEARAYAREIAEATQAAGRDGSIGVATVVSSMLGLLGLLATAGAFGSWLAGEPFAVTTGTLVGLGLLLLLASLLFVTRMLRVLAGHPWRAALLPALLIGVMVGVLTLLTEQLFTVPAVLLGGGGALMLVAGSVVSWFDLRDDTSEITAPGCAPRSGRRRRWLAVLAMPLLTGLVLVQFWLLHGLSS